MPLLEPPSRCDDASQEGTSPEGDAPPGAKGPSEPSPTGRPGEGRACSPAPGARVIKLPVRTRVSDAGRDGGQPQSMDRESHERWIREVVARNRGLLVAEARTYCRNAANAEDLVQDALLRFVQRMAKPDAPCEERGCVLLMLSILTNCFIDLTRRQRVRERYAADPQLQNEVMDPTDTDTPPLFESVTDEQLAQATQALSPKLRTTFELHAKGLKYREIAVTLDTTVGTVSKRIFDARARVREVLLKLMNRSE
jgi:RNA polymerase sigma-70 factor (ECF subfamily)